MFLAFRGSLMSNRWMREKGSVCICKESPGHPTPKSPFDPGCEKHYRRHVPPMNGWHARVRLSVRATCTIWLTRAGRPRPHGHPTNRRRTPTDASVCGIFVTPSVLDWIYAPLGVDALYERARCGVWATRVRWFKPVRI